MTRFFSITLMMSCFCSFESFCATENTTNTLITSRLLNQKNLCTKVFDSTIQAPLSPEDAETIKTYIVQGPIINFYLRNKNNPTYAVVSKSLFAVNNLDEVKIEKILNNLDRILEQQGRRQESKIVYRGESRMNDGSIYVGSRLHYENYISTTGNKELALGYANGNYSGSEFKVLYIITVGRAQYGAQINLLAPEGIRNQDEYLLARNGYLIVNEIQIIDGITNVKATYESSTENK